nr:hypothetical protein [uncultured Flavobacterium sp.]
MTTYLTKTEDGKTHHFRVTVENNGLDIVSGVFYTRMEKYYEGAVDNASATLLRDKLVAEKVKDGFRVTDFTETPENTVNVYDKAKWHYDGEFPDGLDEFQGFVHTGMFLGWLIDNDLVSEEFKLDFDHEIQAFKSQRLIGAQISLQNFMKLWAIEV